MPSHVASLPVATPPVPAPPSTAMPPLPPLPEPPLPEPPEAAQPPSDCIEPPVPALVPPSPPPLSSGNPDSAAQPTMPNANDRTRIEDRMCSSPASCHQQEAIRDETTSFPSEIPRECASLVRRALEGVRALRRQRFCASKHGLLDY